MVHWLLRAIAIKITLDPKSCFLIFDFLHWFSFRIPPPPHLIFLESSLCVEFPVLEQKKSFSCCVCASLDRKKKRKIRQKKERYWIRMTRVCTAARVAFEVAIHHLRQLQHLFPGIVACHGVPPESKADQQRPREIV